MKNRGHRILFLTLLFCTVFTVYAAAAEKSVTVKRVEPEGDTSGYMVIEELEGTQLFTYPNSYFLPGDTAEGTIRFQYQPGIRPVTLKITAQNGADGSAEIFNALRLIIQSENDTVQIYDGKLCDLKNVEISSCQGNSTAEAIEEKTVLKLVFEKTKDQNALQNRKLSFCLSITADMTDYDAVTQTKEGKIEVYRSLHNHKYYYTASGEPALKGQKIKKGAAVKVGYLPDDLVEFGENIGDADDHYFDHADENLEVYVGTDLHFGTADDAKELLLLNSKGKSSGIKNGTNIRRGESGEAAKQFGGKDHTGILDEKKVLISGTETRYTTGLDGIPGTEDDRIIYKGADNQYCVKEDDPADDYYIDEDARKVYIGKDRCFGTEDDAKELLLLDSRGKITGQKNGTNILRGSSGTATEQFGGTGFAGVHYTNGFDGIPGTEDDREISQGADDQYCTGAADPADDYYIDWNDKKEVYIGEDRCFDTEDDAKVLADSSGKKNGTNILRGSFETAAELFGGAGYTGIRYTNGFDSIPGTKDDREIQKGSDDQYCISDTDAADDYYLDTDGAEVYIGEGDRCFGTADDAKALMDSRKEKNGTNVRRGDQETIAEQFGGKGYASNTHYTNGEDGIPGTSDDLPIDQGTDGNYGTADDHYTDPEEEKKVYIGGDLHFGTADDAMLIENHACYLVRGENGSEPFGGAEHNTEHYTVGKDGIPGTHDENEEQVFSGSDGSFDDDKSSGRADDYYKYVVKNVKGVSGIRTDIYNVRAGKDRKWFTGDDELWDYGDDCKHGTRDDKYQKLLYVSAGVGSGSYSGISGEFDASVSPVGFAKAIEGTWEKDELGKWSFTSKDGVKAKSGWKNIYSKKLDRSDWYYFGSDGVMQTGWQKTGNGKWYYLRTVNDERYGAMEKGLYYDSSTGETYYFGTVTGVMQTGWVKIDDKYYYFAVKSEGSPWVWDGKQGKWTKGTGTGRSYGSMYRNETTPDGHRVDANGARID